MRSIRLIAVVLAVLVGLASCSRDPSVVKKRYLESGNKYFDKGRYKEASIQYRNALKRDQKYGPAYYKLAQVSLKTGDISGAVSALRRAVELLHDDQPDHWDAMVRLSEVYLAYGKGEKTFLDDVEKYTAELLKRDANSFDGHRLIGDLKYTKAIDAFRNKHPDEGQAFLKEATAEYRRADSIKPGQQGVSMQLARVLAAGGDFTGAEALFRSVIAKDKTFQGAYSELYRMLLQFENKPVEAEQVLKLAIANNPKQFGYLPVLARHYGVLGRRDDMVAVLNQIKSHAKEYEQAYLTVGDFYLAMGDGDSAIKEYREGIAKDSKQKANYQKHVIEVLMLQGKRNEAAEINSQILKDNPNDNDARGLSASFLLDKGDIAKALAELQAVVTRAPQNPVAHFNLGRAHYKRGEVEQARQQFLKAIELKPDYILPRVELAKLQVARQEFDAALKTAEQILTIDKGSGTAMLIQSAALLGMKKFGESRALLDGMLKSNPGSPDVMYQLGIVNLEEHKYSAAEDSFRRTYQLNPANLRGLLGLVATNLAQGKSEEALRILQTESDKAPNRPDLLLALGNTAVSAGKYDQGVQIFTRMLDMVAKGVPQGDAYLRLGETYRRKGDLNMAVQSMQKARAILPDDPVVLSELALMLDAAQRKPEAKQIYEATLKLDPNSAVVLNNLAFLLAETGGNLDDALTQAQRAKQLRPDLLEISLKKGLPDNAIEVFRDLVSKESSISTYHFHLAMAYKQKGDKTKALDQLREALKYNPAKDEKDNIQRLIASLG